MSITMTVSIAGMTCNHCVQSVSSGVKLLDGVTEVEVALDPQGVSQATITANQDIDRSVIAQAIAEAGYQTVAERD
jgi:copper chaperone CopZ